MDSDLNKTENQPQQAAAQPKRDQKREKKSFGTFTLFDNFAICHYDLSRAYHRPDKKFLDAVTVGHVLRRGFMDTRSKNPSVRARGARLVQEWDESIRDGLMKVYEQHQAVTELYEQDPIDHGEILLGEGVTFDIHWNDPRFFYLVRMALMLDEANVRLRKLTNSGFIDKNTMKHKQRALAQPFHATLHGITSLAAKVHKEFKAEHGEVGAAQAQAEHDAAPPTDTDEGDAPSLNGADAPAPMALADTMTDDFQTTGDEPITAAVADDDEGGLLKKVAAKAKTKITTKKKVVKKAAKKTAKKKATKKKTTKKK